MKKSVFIFLINIILILYTFFGQISTVFAEPEEGPEEAEKITVEAYVGEDGKIIPPDLLAEGAVLIDAETGAILFEKNMNTRFYPASTTKVMTAILALENGNFDDIVYFSDEACDIEPGSSSIGMKPGEIITLDEAMNGLMIHSANEVGNALGEYVSGSVEEFCELMTERAKTLGAENTNYENPHGLHDENHYTTPYDLALIFRHGLEYPYFRDIVKRQYYQIPPTNITDIERNLYTKNRIIMSNSPFYYEYCEGGKTGFTDEAMHTLVTYAEKDGVRLIAAVMKDPANGTYTDTRALYEYGFSFFRSERIFDRYSFSREIPVIQSTDKEPLERGIVVVQADRGIRKTLRQDILDAGFEQIITLPEILEAPIKKGDKIGSISLLSEGKEIDSIDLFALNSVDTLDLERIKEIRKEEFIAETKSKLPIYLAFVPIVILAVSIVISVIIRAVKKKKERNRYGFGSKSKYKFKKE